MENGAGSQRRTLIEEGTAFTGTLVSTCPIDVRGRVDGQIETPALTVSEGGAVHGRVKVGEVRSEGELSGEFDAERVELAGSVRDSTVIRARALEVKLNAQRGKLQVVFGECELSIGDEPSEHDMLDEPKAAAAMSETPSQPAEAPLEPPPLQPVLVTEPPPVSAEHALPAEQLSNADTSLAAAPPGDAPGESDDEEDEDQDEDQDEDEADEEALNAREAGAPIQEQTSSKRSRKRKRARREAEKSWSHPPSQPPPAE
jgi:cytoskeletal protein CcmA (bactofilin family)